VSGALVAGLLAGYGVAVPVGAIAAMLVGLTARTSFRVGAAAALGVATADGLYALVAVLGGAAIAGLVRPAAPVLRVVAAVVLVGIAARIALAALRERRSASPAVSLDAPGRAYVALLGLTLLNPGTVVYFGALVLGRQAAGGLAGWAAAVFVLAAFAASASWQLLLAGTGALVGRLLTGPRGRLLSAIASSVVITVLAVGLLR
jgi:arginine exporter protein ArgO